jgi:hypothetical protein
MNIQAQLLPHKHIRFCESLIGLSGCIRQLLHEPLTIDEIWTMLNQDNSSWLYKPSFEQIVLAVVLLFTIGQIEPTDNHRIQLIKAS